MSDTNTETNVAAEELRAFIERILRLKEEQDTIGQDIKDVYSEAKSFGYDKTVMGLLVAEIRNRQKNSARAEEIQTVLDLYRDAWHAACTHAYARKAA